MKKLFLFLFPILFTSPIFGQSVNFDDANFNLFWGDTYTYAYLAARTGYTLPNTATFSYYYFFINGYDGSGGLVSTVRIDTGNPSYTMPGSNSGAVSFDLSVRCCDVGLVDLAAN